MRKIVILVTALSVCAICLNSCRSISSEIVPTAINTINSVRLGELNLDRTDYKILNTITVEATIKYKQSGDEIKIQEENNEFMIEFEKVELDNGTERWVYSGCEGVARYGFLTNDYKNAGNTSYMNPEQIARNLAIYRLINACKVAGGDGVIEPIVSTNVGQEGKEIIFKTTVAAKVIKINTDK